MSSWSGSWLTVFARYRLGNLQDIFRRERPEFQACHRYIPFQIGKPLDQPWIHGACFHAPAQQQQNRRRALRPLSPLVLEEVQGPFVCPLEVIDKDEQRRPHGISLSQARQRFKEPGSIECLVDGGSRQGGVTLAQLREQEGKLAQPGIAQELMKVLLPP